MKKIYFIAAICAAGAACACGSGKGGDSVAPDTLIENKVVMYDSEGNPINCHGGGILKVDSVYYWYGEHRDGFDNQLGVNCYSTKDFKTFDYQGVALPLPRGENKNPEFGGLIERPKVVYNAKTGKYVMWFHNEMTPYDYSAAHYGVAVSDTPTGPFEFVKSARVNPGIYPMNLPDSLKGKRTEWDTMEWWTPEWYEAIEEGMFVNRDLAGGQMSRDQTIYIDDDGTGYHIYSSEDNLTLNIAELTDDYQGHTGRYIRIMPAGHNEAPAVVKHDGKYWIIASGCTGWDPNKARMMWADSMLGEWTQAEGTPCVGEDAEITFGGQSAYIFDLDGMPVFLADIWRPEQLADSRYIWLPIEFTEDGAPQITYNQYLIKK